MIGRNLKGYMSMSRSIMVVFASAECGDDEPQTNADGPTLTLGRDKEGASVSAAQSAKVCG